MLSRTITLLAKKQSIKRCKVSSWLSLRQLGTERSNGSGPESSEKVLITTPIFYVNGRPHIGHAYSGLLCDALARWMRLKGNMVLFSTGTDEHGSKVEKASIDAGFESCKTYCDSISNEFRKLCETLGLSQDVFIRTTDEQHSVTVNNLWRRLENGGYISEGKHSGWYCQSDEAFLTEKQVGEHPSKPGVMVSLESGHTVEWLDESNYVFHLSKFETRLLEWLQTEREGVPALSPLARKNEIESFITSKSIKDLSVSRPRSRVRWAIQVPTDESQSIYVWMDALANYLTVAGVDIPSDPAKPAAWSSAGISRVIHVVGKDIVRFHSIYWPAFLMAAGLNPPDNVIAHAHWTVDRTKMSKSLGNVICPFDLVAKYGQDSVRYALLRNGGLVDDSDFSFSMLESRRRDELANTFGNLLSRSRAKRISPYKSWPPVLANLNPEDSDLGRLHLSSLADRVDDHFSKMEFARGLEAIMAALHEANRVFTADEPWVARKKLKELKSSGQSESSSEAMDLHHKVDTTLFWMFESLRISSILLQPVMPEASRTALDCLGIPESERSFLDAKKITSSHSRYNFPAAPSLVLFPPLEEEVAGK